MILARLLPSSADTSSWEEEEDGEEEEDEEEEDEDLRSICVPTSSKGSFRLV